MNHATVLSKKYVLKFVDQIQGCTIEDEMARVLRILGDRLNYKGKIMGHLKTIVTSGEHFLHMSLTNLPDINIKADAGWYKKEYTDFALTINIIIYGYSKDQLEAFLCESMEGTIFTQSNN